MLSGRILVVENDVIVRLGTVMMLREMGIEVEEADSADAALAIGANGSPVEILITDFSMPGRSGVQLAHEMERRHPSIKILVVSGHPAERLRLPAHWGMLGKPFTCEELRQSLRALVADPVEAPES